MTAPVGEPQIPRPPAAPLNPRPPLDIPLGLPAVARLRAAVRAHDADTVEEQLRLALIPSPSFAEAARGRRVAERFAALGLADVATDAVGNVLARLPGSGAGTDGAVVFAAHLDSVFPADTELRVRREGSRILAPGITDNARGLAGMLALARVLAGGGVRTRRPVLFAATVGEEGLGDLAGVKHLFRRGAPLRAASAVVALDGSGIRRVVHRAIGSLRLRVRFTGPGGHSWADRGAPNPAHALGRAVASLAGLTLPSPAHSSLTVARVGGGTSINTIPDEAWLELDLRSEANGALKEMERTTRRVIAAALAAENGARRGTAPPLHCRVDVIGDRPSGETPADAPLVRLALAVTTALGERPELVASSTDANLPISLGIPAIAIGVGGDSGGIHTVEEWYENERGPLGIERALLIALLAAEWDGVSG